MKIHELTLHKDPRIFNLNELDYRSYFIPFESEEATLPTPDAILAAINAANA